jgi:hypothetical protein
MEKYRYRSFIIPSFENRQYSNPPNKYLKVGNLEKPGNNEG